MQQMVLYCKTYCSLNVFRAPLCLSSGAQEYCTGGCVRAQFSGCSSTTNVHSETGQVAVCCKNLPLGALSSRSAPSVLVGGLFKKFVFF